MSQKTDKKATCLRISHSIYCEFNKCVAEKYGNIYGHIAQSIDEALLLWIRSEKEKVNETGNQRK